MEEIESLNHTKWECKYHVVFIPKCRRKTLYGELRRHLGPVFKKLSMEADVKAHHHHSPGNTPILASGVHPRS
jgi:putative transposase